MLQRAVKRGYKMIAVDNLALRKTERAHAAFLMQLYLLKPADHCWFSLIANAFESGLLTVGKEATSLAVTNAGED